jgi:hypothetical protein
MLPWVLCAVLFLVVAALSLKIYLLHRDMDTLIGDLRELLSTDTNTLLSTASNDRQFRKFVSALNRELRLLRVQRQRYVSGDRELKDAVTNISHDLRTPLTAICGYLELLEQEEKSEAVERYLAIITNRTEVLKQLTEELFRYSVIITAEPHEKESVVINTVLEESIAAFYAALQEKKITPNIQMPEAKVSRCLDRSALSRVFSNLLNNAIKYSDGDLDIALSETGEICFCNTASGLNEVQVGKLFDRFYTVEAARKSTGLGLAIARTLVEQMGGTIRAAYDSNRLRIYILFPDERS